MRLIDADALIDFIDCGHLRNPLESCFSERDVVDMLESCPTIDAVPVVRGKWKPIFKGADTCECSVCKSEGFSDSDFGFIATPYCPNCGAKMEVNQDE
jgi:hypothetical protein